MFAAHLHSYRDLPLRYADFGVLHRNEISGALTGLTRVRRFQQDDAHIFCREDQIESEVQGVLDMLEAVYGVFGFQYSLALSTRPARYMGEVEVWDRAEKALEESLDRFVRQKNSKDQLAWRAEAPFAPMSWTLQAGEGAFYGPKIDIQLRDALNRRHQCATIQLDFQLPLRFELSYKREDSSLHRPVIIHRAILGSVERMIAVLVEHTGGKWPLWLSPRQVQVVPVTEALLPYAHSVQALLLSDGLHCDVNTSSATLNKKIREAQLEQYNLILVVGSKEEGGRTVTVRQRDDPGKQTTMAVDEFRQRCSKLIAQYKEWEQESE
jgi:threonyl-tRNA synthetase